MGKEKAAKEKAARAKAAREKAAKEKWERERYARDKAAREKKISDRLNAAGCSLNTTLIVQPGLNSLSKAVKEAKRRGVGCLYLLNGVHDEKGEIIFNVHLRSYRNICIQMTPKLKKLY